jgi:hypothetical protein
MPEPIPRRWLSAFAWFFLNLHRPSPRNGWVGFPLCSANTIFHGEFSRFQLFRDVQASEFACLPDRSYRCSYRCKAAEPFTSEQNMRRYLRMHRICFPPDTGNWRNEDSHLARFAALSAAHISVTRLSWLLLIKGYETYRAGATFGLGA